MWYHVDGDTISFGEYSNPPIIPETAEALHRNWVVHQNDKEKWTLQHVWSDYKDDNLKTKPVWVDPHFIQWKNGSDTTTTIDAYTQEKVQKDASSKPSSNVLGQPWVNRGTQQTLSAQMTPEGKCELKCNDGKPFTIDCGPRSVFHRGWFATNSHESPNIVRVYRIQSEKFTNRDIGTVVQTAGSALKIDDKGDLEGESKAPGQLTIEKVTPQFVTTRSGRIFRNPAGTNIELVRLENVTVPGSFTMTAGDAGCVVWDLQTGLTIATRSAYQEAEAHQSVCNPPCKEGQICNVNQECEPSLHGGSLFNELPEQVPAVHHLSDHNIKRMDGLRFYDGSTHIDTPIDSVLIHTSQGDDGRYDVVVADGNGKQQCLSMETPMLKKGTFEYKKWMRRFAYNCYEQPDTLLKKVNQDDVTYNEETYVETQRI